MVGEFYDLDVGILQQSFEFLFGLFEHVETLCGPLPQGLLSGATLATLEFTLRASLCRLIHIDVASIFESS